MTAARVTAMMRRLSLDADQASAARAMSGPELEATYGLTPEESAAILDRRLDLLYGMGVHEVSLMQFSRTFRFTLAERWRELADRA